MALLLPRPPHRLGPLDKVLKLGLWLACQRRGYRAVRRHWGGAAPDLIHAHVLLRTGLAAWWLKWRRGIPYVVTEHWTLYLPARVAQVGRVRQFLTRAVVRRAGALHAVSRALADALGALGARAPRTAIIANVVDANLFRPVAAGAPSPDKARPPA
ncbi:glycosyltransferase, partial [Hymenobacter coccineus]|uniref:glycosyltransferase n=1 Tax=Hymenobacter coccineus TaxID=1908235 RepID=UPI001301258F